MSVIFAVAINWMSIIFLVRCKINEGDISWMHNYFMRRYDTYIMYYTECAIQGLLHIAFLNEMSNKSWLFTNTKKSGKPSYLLPLAFCLLPKSGQVFDATQMKLLYQSYSFWEIHFCLVSVEELCYRNVMQKRKF